MIVIIILIILGILQMNVAKPHYKLETVTADRISLCYHWEMYLLLNIKVPLDLCCLETCNFVIPFSPLQS